MASTRMSVKWGTRRFAGRDDLQASRVGALPPGGTCETANANNLQTSCQGREGKNLCRIGMCKRTAHEQQACLRKSELTPDHGDVQRR